MRKTLPEVASYLKTILPPVADEMYNIHSDFLEIAGEEKIRTGVLSYWAFLIRLFQQAILEGNSFDTSKKVIHAYENRTTLSVYYPFLNHLKNLLMIIGLTGTPTTEGQALSCTPAIFNEKLSTDKTLECLHFLASCGLEISGLNLTDKRVNLFEPSIIYVSYPDDPHMLVGLKIMALAETNRGNLKNQDIFFRCDYHSLKTEAPCNLAIIKDTISSLPDTIQDVVLELHERYLKAGLTCEIEIKGFHIYIKYCLKRKDLFGINASMNNGFHINVKPLKTEDYPETVQDLSPILQKKIEAGYGCGRKRTIARCDGGCRGLTIPLDDTILDLKEDIITWFDQEISWRNKK